MNCNKKKRNALSVKKIVCLAMTAFCILQSTQVVMATETESAVSTESSLIASDSERAAQETINTDGLEVVTGDDLIDGEYEIDVESSSSMFKIVSAVLYVENGTMSADITLSGTGYGKLYMGTGEDAIEASEEDYASYQESDDEDAGYMYHVEVEALNQVLECTGWSLRKEKWYDHQIMFIAASLPDEAFANQEEVVLDLEDGDYTVEVSLSGGSGKASLTSPTTLHVENGVGIVTLEWSSSYYDYMIVDDVTYYPVNEEGNSVFEIPINALDTPQNVVADTTAMSVPHEISYTITYTNAIAIEENTTNVWIWIVVGMVVILVVGVIFFYAKKKTVHTSH